MLTAQQVIEAIHGSYATGSKNGFHNVLAMLDEMGTKMTIPILHVAGTNGKGSTCAMLERILRAAGCKTGLYTSPFLQAYPERIRFDGVPMTDDLLMKYGNPLVKAAEKLRAEDAFVTPFEMGTALALTAFEGEKCDVAVVEVGMGGRLDPTNIVTPVVSVITAIGLDHMGFLGNTLAAIAGEKAGIIKPGVPVVCHPAEPEVEAVFRRAAEKKGSPLRQLRKTDLLSVNCGMHGSTASYCLDETWMDVELSLVGEYQTINAMTVLATVEELRRQGWNLPDEAVREGLRSTVWPARLEWCGNILIDGAHNIQGVSALAEFVRGHLADRPKVLLTGVLADKLQPEMLRQFCDISRTIVTVTPDNPRALDAAEYKAALGKYGAAATAASSLEEGLALARKWAGEDGVIVAAGSLYFAGALRTALGLPWA